jgi:hypothetical protein
VEQEQQAHEEFQAHEARKVREVPQARPELRVRPVRLALEGLQERQEPQEHAALLGPQELRVRPAHEGHKAHKARKGHQVLVMCE